VTSSPEEGISTKGRALLKKVLRDPLQDLYWGIYGRMLRNPSVPMGSSSILFVCTGNICRSPFAEQMFRIKANGAGRKEFRVLSAGMEVTSPNPSPSEAVQSALQFGVDLGSHRSRRITAEMVSNVDLVVGMDAGHIRSLRKAFPHRIDRIFLLPLIRGRCDPREANYHRFNIFDPFGRSPDQFLDCFRRITACIEDLLEILARQDGEDES